MTADQLERAACKPYPTDWWYPLAVGNTRAYRMSVEQWRKAGAKAINICATCPVRVPCRDEAVRNYDWHGIIGGLTPPEIRDLSGRAPTHAWNSSTKRHGSESDYVHGCHCDQCKAGHAAYQRRYRAEQAS